MADAHCGIPWKRKGYCWRNMLLTGCNLPQISFKIRSNILAKKYNAWNECNTSFNEVKPHSIFFSMAFAFTGGTSLFQKNCLEDTIIPQVKRIILAKIQYVNKCNTSLMKLRLTIIFLHKICFKRKNRLLKNYVCFVLLFHSYARAYCIHATMSLPKSTIYTLLLHNNDSLYCCIFFFNQLVHSLIKVYIGSFAHTGTNTFFKEDHIHLKQVLKGFHSDILLSFFHYFF